MMQDQNMLERRLEFTEEKMLHYGACEVRTNEKNRKLLGWRKTFRYQKNYFRISSAEFDEKAYIVFSSIDDRTYADVGLMEDIDAVLSDASDEMIDRKVRYVLGLDAGNMQGDTV